MVPCGWFPEAVKMLNENPGLDVGVHVVLTSEWENIKWRPLTDSPSLTDADGYFYPTIWSRKGAPPGTALREANWKIEEIEKEMRAQIELAMRKIPHVSHLTCHMGCSGWDPKVRELWTRLAKEYKLDNSATAKANSSLLPVSSVTRQQAPAPRRSSPPPRAVRTQPRQPTPRIIIPRRTRTTPT